MTHTERLNRIIAMQDECDRIIEGCEDRDCGPCPTCEAMEDVQRTLVVARGLAGWMVQPEREVA
jgi:hypothetical protein